MSIQLEEPNTAREGVVLLRAGFRPFFLLTALWAAFSIPLWLVVLSSSSAIGLEYPAYFWHAHEMVFGFAGAALAGFLLTAVPNWTGAKPVAGLPLLALVLVWLAARALLLFWPAVPGWWAVLPDLAFFPILGALLARPLILAGKPRNMVFLVILSVLTLASLLVHLEVIEGLATGRSGLMLGVYLFALMIAIIGGRIVPAFTQNGLRMAGIAVEITPLSWLEKAAPLSVAAAGIAQALQPDGMAPALLSLLAGALNLLRLSRWKGAKTLGHPILWVLHAGYGWLGLGLVLHGLAGLTGLFAPSAALHALTAGAFGTMILGVGSRAALGHSGRPLVLAKATVLAYGLVILAGVARVAPAVLGVDGLWSLHLSGALWSLGWLVFGITYWPILTRPRLDGRPG